MTCENCSRFHEVIDPIDGTISCMCYLKKVPVLRRDTCDMFSPSIWVTNSILAKKKEEDAEWLRQNFKKQ